MTLYDEKPNQVDAEEFKNGSEKEIARFLGSCGYGNIAAHLNPLGDTLAISAIKKGDGFVIRIEPGQWLVRALDGTVVAMNSGDFRKQYRVAPKTTPAKPKSSTESEDDPWG
jgi:hypothetical protein